MSTNASSAEKRTDRTDPRPDSILLGIDTDGDSHHFSTVNDLIIAVEADGSLANAVDIVHERRQRDTDRIVDEYVEFVGDIEGWASRWYVVDFADLLAEASQ